MIKRIINSNMSTAKKAFSMIALMYAISAVFGVAILWWTGDLWYQQ